MVTRVAVAVVLVLSVLSMTGTAVAQEECRGTKQYYAGKCRYPKDIAALKKQAQAQKAKEKEEARRRAQQAAAAKKEEARKADQAACEVARSANTVAGWKTYLKTHSSGACLDEAIKRITEISGTPPPAPEPQPAEPQPEPVPDPVAPVPTPDPGPEQPVPAPKTTESSGVHPLVWIGFGVGGLGLIIGAITGGVSFGEAQTLQDECPDNVCPSDRQDDVDSMLTLAHVSTAMFVIAGVGTALGVVGLFLGGSDDEQAVLDLHIGPGTLMMTGSF